MISPYMKTYQKAVSNFKGSSQISKKEKRLIANAVSCYLQTFG